MTWADWVDAELAAIRAADRWRDPRGDRWRRPPAPRSVNFASNDYLGLTQHPAVVAAAHDALDRERHRRRARPASSSVSRTVHHDLEAEIADWKGTERAVLFATGYQTNLAVLTTFGAPTRGLCSDELNHASIIDGCRLARAEVAIYRHGDVDHAASLLSRGGPRDRRDRFGVLDGRRRRPPRRPRRRCAGPRARCSWSTRPTPCSGPTRSGPTTTSTSCASGTLSKTLGSLGGFVAASGGICDLLVNRARPYIFTTASTPADTAAALAALAVLALARRRSVGRPPARPRRTGARRSPLTHRSRRDRRRAGRHRRRLVLGRPRAVGPGDSAPDRRRRARRGFGSRSRRPTPTTTSPGWSTRVERNSMTRPKRVVVVAGTGTEVGKTFVGAAIAAS